MRINRRGPFRGPVIMQMDFFPSRGNPPSIHHLPKNYIDLLYRRSSEHRLRFPLYDDRQISILIVNYHVQFPVENPSIRISMASLGDYLKDLKLLSLIKSEHRFTEDDWCYSYDSSEIFYRDKENIEFERAYDRLLDHREFLSDIGKEYSEANFENILIRDAQAAFLKLNKFDSSDLAYIYFTQPSGLGDIMDSLFNEGRSWIISSPFNELKPFGLPTQEGETGVFKETVRQKMNEFCKRYPLLTPLLANLSLTILYIPPRNQEIDLDNLARYIVPLVNEALNPPTSFWFSEVPKKFPKHTIIQYQVIKLPRSMGDPSDGLVSILLNEHETYNNIWEETDSIIERWSDIALD